MKKLSKYTEELTDKQKIEALKTEFRLLNDKAQNLANEIMHTREFYNLI